MVIMSSMAAAVQGMDEAVINGAQIIYPKQFGIGSGSCMFPSSLLRSWSDVLVSARFRTHRLGQLSTVPVSWVLRDKVSDYLMFLFSCCAVIGCWLTDPLNKVLGRKKTIFVTCAIRCVSFTRCSQALICNFAQFLDLYLECFH